MLFDENEMIELCKEMGIDIINEKGKPLYKGEEFSATDFVDSFKEPISSETSRVISIELLMKYMKNFTKESDFMPFFSASGGILSKETIIIGQKQVSDNQTSTSHSVVAA